MAIKKLRPMTPGQRGMSKSTFEEITTSTPHKALLTPLSSSGGRNASGKTTARFKGGCHKKHYRIIDFKRNKTGVPGKVATIEYDPNRNARIALIFYVDVEKRYILAPNGLEVGMTIIASSEADIKVGNAMPLKNIPLGTSIHNIE